MIHTTIGIYPDESYKVNGVKSEDLTSHIEYNKTFRFGRTLIVDGEIINQGYLSKDKIKEIISNKKLNAISMQVCTAPYV